MFFTNLVADKSARSRKSKTHILTDKSRYEDHEPLRVGGVQDHGRYLHLNKGTGESTPVHCAQGSYQSGLPGAGYKIKRLCAKKPAECNSGHRPSKRRGTGSEAVGTKWRLKELYRC